jgi:hypothetical protein
MLPEDAPRAAVMRQLRAWSQRRAPKPGDPPGARQEEPLLAAITDGSPGCWDGFCEAVHASGLYIDMLATAPGLWSHCRLAAGPSWHGVATVTRGLIRHLGAITLPGVAPGERQDAHGVGCVAIDRERLWLADHLLYACQDDLEIGLDCRFYGCARDPDLHGVSEHRFQWSFVQKRWFTVMAGLGPAQLPEAGWISSPRWLFPLPAHALPRSALAGPLGQRLWRAALTAADGCATSVCSQPLPWWRDQRLVPGPQWAGRWAAGEQRGGFGVLSPDDLAARRCDDPCTLPMALAAIAPGAEHPLDRVWALFACLERALRRLLAPFDHGQPGAPTCIDLALPYGGQRLEMEQDGDRRCVNGWAVSRALGLAGLMPSFQHLQGLGDWPPSTLLRSGMAAGLLAHAAPVMRHGAAGQSHGTNLEIGKLSWSWSEPGWPLVPSGWATIDGDRLGQAVARPGWVELEGGTSYDTVTKD